MSLGYSLTAVIAAFLAILITVVYVAFRERRIAQAIAPDDDQARQASDARMLVTIFLAIPGGMVLTGIVAWLVFM